MNEIANKNFEPFDHQIFIIGQVSDSTPNSEAIENRNDLANFEQVLE